MTREELLLELKDISPPAEPGWWLLAPGQLVVILLLVCVIAALWLLLLRRRARRRFSAASLELQRIKSGYEKNRDTQRLARELARWLKQVALLAFPDRRLEGAVGVHWLDFLDSSLGDNSFTRGDGRIFSDAVYQPRPQLDAGRILSLCERWLAAVKPRLLQPGRD